MENLKTFKEFITEGILNEESSKQSPKKFVNGKLKNFIFIYDEKSQEIGCKFSKTWEEEVDTIEGDEAYGKIFKSSQISDKGVRPIQIKYMPVKGVDWKDFVKELEDVFDSIFE